LGPVLWRSHGSTTIETCSKIWNSKSQQERYTEALVHTQVARGHNIYPIRCQFHQHFTSVFYKLISQKRKKILMTWMSFCAFGICVHKKLCLNMLVKSAPGWPRARWALEKVLPWSHPMQVGFEPITRQKIYSTNLNIQENDSASPGCIECHVATSNICWFWDFHFHIVEIKATRSSFSLVRFFLFRQETKTTDSFFSVQSNN